MGFGLLGFRDEDLGVKETKVLGCGACGRLGIATSTPAFSSEDWDGKRRSNVDNIFEPSTAGFGIESPKPGQCLGPAGLC